MKNCVNEGAVFAAAGIVAGSGDTTHEHILTNNTNKGNVSTNYAGRAAQIASYINTTDRSSISLTASGNVAEGGAKVTLKAATEPDTTTANHLINFWNSAAVLNDYLD